MPAEQSTATEEQATTLDELHGQARQAFADSYQQWAALSFYAHEALQATLVAKRLCEVLADATSELATDDSDSASN